jgi:hypothetical protein
MMRNITKIYIIYYNTYCYAAKNNKKYRFF